MLLINDLKVFKSNISYTREVIKAHRCFEQFVHILCTLYPHLIHKKGITFLVNLLNILLKPIDNSQFFVIIYLMFFNVEEVEKNEDDIPTKEKTEI